MTTHRAPRPLVRMVGALVVCALALSLVPGSMVWGSEIKLQPLAVLLIFDPVHDTDAASAVKLKYPRTAGNLLQVLEVGSRGETALAYRWDDLSGAVDVVNPVLDHPEVAEGGGDAFSSLDDRPRVRAFFDDGSLLMTDLRGHWWRHIMDGRDVPQPPQDRLIRAFHAGDGLEIFGLADHLLLNGQRFETCNQELFSLALRNNVLAAGVVEPNSQRSVCLMRVDQVNFCTCDRPTNDDHQEQPKISQDGRHLALAVKRDDGFWLVLAGLAGAGMRAGPIIEVPMLRVHGLHFDHNTFYYDASFSWAGNRLVFRAGSAQETRRIGLIDCADEQCSETHWLEVPDCLAVTFPENVWTWSESRRVWASGHDNGCAPLARTAYAVRVYAVYWPSLYRSEQAYLLAVDANIRLESADSGARSEPMRRILIFRLLE